MIEFTYLVFTRLPGESYRRCLRSLLCRVTYFERYSTDFSTRSQRERERETDRDRDRDRETDR